MMDSEKKEIVRRPRTVTPVVETMPADLLTPLVVFLALSSASGNCFLLESVEGGETLARYSFIGVNPERIVSGNGKRITVIEGKRERYEDRPLLDFLKEEFEHISANVSADLPSVLG
jgi:anthranilate synthase component 1